MALQLLGHQEPRQLIVPPSYSNAAGEAIDLYQSLGPKLDPWQKLCLHSALGEDRLGEWVAFIVAFILARQNGKGGVTEAWELACLFLFGDQLIIHSAHRVDTAMKAYARVKDLIDGSYDLSRRVKKMIDSSGEAFIELMTGQKLEFRTRSATGGRGLTAGKLVLDEALELQMEQMAALLPTLLAIPGAQVLITSTVPKQAIQYLADLRRRVLAGDNERVSYLEWGVDRGAKLDDPAALAAANPALGIRLTLEKLKDLRRELGDDLFARECMSIWPREADAEWLVIPEADWTDRQVPVSSQIVGRPAFGVYVNPDRSYAAIVAAGYREDGSRQVEITVNDEDVVDLRPGTRWIVGRLQELERHRPVAVVIDDKAVFEEAEAAKLDVHRSSTSDVVTGCGLMFDGIAGPDKAAADVHHIGQVEMTAAAAGAVKRNVGNSWAWDRRTPTVEVSPVPAASLALFGLCTPRIHRQEAAAPWAIYA